MTQEEVEVMAKGGPDTHKIIERLANQGGGVTAFSEKASPVAISTEDLAKINASGALPENIRHALDQSSRPPAEYVDRRVVTHKSAPTDAPPDTYKDRE